MLFGITYTNPAHGDEARDKRSLKMLQAWKPPTGFEFKGWYDYADGSGGMAIVEAATAELLLEAVAPWNTFFEFSVKPLVAADTSTPIYVKAAAWRDSIK